ncbi:DUF167 domain-containing protein [Roseococcus pinisoli]|uniref:UPF0235 protein KHU32_19635 n=1 Tax=Roseococcus pinisoli TaxID=2835040 RepID=A0ABS5QHX4_9PROT|nr:DUF167 domain-containing protein [Roseococcus pinisoli]MBS7813167.1 DUF167 domain-containing protein [Roseococcus pinisoli]
MPFSIVGKGLRLAVRLTPRASREGVDGVIEGADGRRMLQLRLAAPPVDGAANAALVAFVAKALRLRKSEVMIATGEKSRLKLLELSGDPADLKARVEAWIAGST